MRLYINGEPAVIGKVYESFRGEKMKLLGAVEPHKPGSTGRVIVGEHGSKSEYYPSVIGGEWRE
jgi:hypothetical protein